MICFSSIRIILYFKVYTNCFSIKSKILYIPWTCFPTMREFNISNPIYWSSNISFIKEYNTKSIYFISLISFILTSKVRISIISESAYAGCS
nr:MAG TPA: hypothetical protein [Crassvirales sp.]